MKKYTWQLLWVALFIFMIIQHISGIWYDTAEFEQTTDWKLPLLIYGGQMAILALIQYVFWKIKQAWMFIVFVLFSLNLGIGQSQDSVKVPKSVLQELVNYLPKQPNQATNIITNPIDLTNVRTAGMWALSIPGGLGRQLLLTVQSSPYDEEFVNKGLLVGQGYYAEIRTNWNGEQVIVFKRK